MPWFMGDDNDPFHAKTKALLADALDGDYRGMAAKTLWYLGGCVSQRDGTDGMVSRIEMIRVVLNPAMVDELAALLVDVRLWHAPGHSCAQCPPVEPGHWVFHDWFNPRTKYTPGATVKLKRDKSAELKDHVLVAAVWARDCIDPANPMVGKCRYCGRIVKRKDNRSTDERVRPEMDHVDPRQAIGARNVVLSCRGCNSDKGSRTPEQAGMTLRPPPRPEPADDTTSTTDDGPATPGASGHTNPGSSRGSSPAAPASASGPSSVAVGVRDETTQRASTSDQAGPQERPAGTGLDQLAANQTAPSGGITAGPPADHPPDHARYQSDSAVPRGRGPGQGQGQGQGQGHGLGQGTGTRAGSPPPRAGGETAAQKRRRRRGRSRSRGRGSTAGVDHRTSRTPENMPDFIPPAPVTSDDAMDAGATPPGMHVLNGVGSPYYDWSGAWSTVGDETDCPDHHLPQPCWKCADERNEG